MSNDTTTDILTRAEHHMLRSEVEELLMKNQQLRASLQQEQQQYQEMVAKHGQWHALYTELKTHIQDVLNDTGAWDDFDTEKLAKHGIAKPPTLYSCEYKVKYTGTVTVKADSEEAARNKADEIMSKAIYCQLSEIDDEQVSDQNHNEFELEINDCEEQ